MKPDLVPSEPMTQVIFILDYIQLAFQETGFSIYNDPELSLGGKSLRRDQVGFCDALVGLIGKRIESVASSDEKSLMLTFADGSVLSVGRIGPGPEAWDFQCRGGPIVVEQNA